MTNEQIIITVSIMIFLVVGLLIKRKKSNSIREFTMEKEKLNWFSIAAGISMTFAGGAAILNMASLGYTFKWYTLVDPISLFIGIMIVVYFYNYYKNDEGVTISNLLSDNDKKLGILIGIITTFVFILIVSAQFVALSKLVSPYFPDLNPLFITIVLSTSIFSYVFLGGFSSVTKTDILQLIFIVLFLLIPLVFFILINNSAIININDHTFAVMPLDYIILFSIPILFIPLSQDINIRVKSAKNAKNGKLGLLIGAALYFSIVLVASFIGIYLANNNIALTDPETAYTLFFQNYFPSFGFIGIIAALAAIVSSLDSYTLNAITSFSNDILLPIPSLKNKNNRTLIKISGTIIYVVSISIALFFNEILLLVLTALLIYIAVLFPIAFGKKLGVGDNYIFISSLLTISSIAFIEIFHLNVEYKVVIYTLIGLSLMFLSFFHKKLFA